MTDRMRIDMNKIAQSLIGATAAVLLLAGCSAVNAEPVSQAVPTASASSGATPSSTPSAAPISMKPTAPDNRSEAQKNGFKDENDWYLRSIKTAWSGDMPSDQQLLAAASLACDALAKGTPRDQIHAVTGDGDAVVNNNRDLVNYAKMALCP